MKQDIKLEITRPADCSKLAIVQVTNGKDRFAIRVAMKNRPDGVMAIPDEQLDSIMPIDLSGIGTEFTSATVRMCSIEDVPLSSLSLFIYEQRKCLVERIGVIKFAELDHYISFRIKNGLATVN